MELNQLHFFTATIFFFLASAKTCKTCLLEAAPNPILTDSRNAEQIKYVGGEWNGDGESRYGFGLSCSKSAGNGAGQEAGCQNSRPSLFLYLDTELKQLSVSLLTPVPAA